MNATTDAPAGVSQRDLNEWRNFVEIVRTASFSLRMDLATGAKDRARAKLEALHNAAVATGKAMEAAGAVRPGSLPTSRPVPPELLDTETNRRYLETLEAAHAAALDRDRELFGEIGAHGRAQVIEMVLADVREELAPTVSQRLAERLERHGAKE